MKHISDDSDLDPDYNTGYLTKYLRNLTFFVRIILNNLKLLSIKTPRFNLNRKL